MENNPFLTSLLQQQETWQQQLPGSNQPLIHQLRQNAMQRAMAIGFPHPRLPTWKYAMLQPLSHTALGLSVPVSAVSPSSLTPYLSSQPDWNVLVFINGHYFAKLSKKNNFFPEITLTYLTKIGKAHPVLLQTLIEEGGKDEQFFPLMNNALATDGALIVIPDDCHIFVPIVICHFLIDEGPPSLVNTQSHIHIGKNATCFVVEKFISKTTTLSCLNTQTLIKCDSNSKLIYYRLGCHNENTYHFNYMRAELFEQSQLDLTDIAFGGTYYRNQQNILLKDEQAQCKSYGLMLAKTDSHLDWVSHLSHLAPACQSSQKIKSVVGAHGHSSFLGNIFVPTQATQTSAHMLNQNLLLSTKGRADTAPELEILTDDVQCTHGASVGQLDENALFYLRSRGFNEQQARNLLTTAFVQDILATLHDEIIQHDFQQLLQPAFAPLFDEEMT